MIRTRFNEDIAVSIRLKEQLETAMIVQKDCHGARSVFYLSSLFAKKGIPNDPEELLEHDCLTLRIPVDGRLFSWAFL